MVNSSVEYYHYCTSYPPLIDVLNVRPPRTDSAFVASVFGSGNYREYFGCWLPSLLVLGQVYCVSFWIAISPYSIKTVDRYQLLFSVDKPLQNYPPLPSFILDSAQFTYYGYVTKTDPWTNISGSFVADGTERFMTFGVFDPLESIAPIINNPNGTSSAYYYIDDVALYPCNAPVEVADAGPDRHVCLGDSVQVGTHELAEYRYYWYIDSVLVSREARPVFSITQPTTYVLLVKDFKFDESWDTLILYPVNCDTIPLGCGQKDVFVCQEDSTLLGCHDRQDFHYTWRQPPDTSVFATNGQIWVKPESSTQYVLHTTDYTGRESYDTIRLIPVNCNRDEVPLLIPNAFSPNGDGLNDYFEIFAPPGTQLDVMIFSRWGNQLFHGDQSRPWDGTYHNIPVPLGTYYYSIKATLPPYRPTIVTGNVTVVK